MLEESKIKERIKQHPITSISQSVKDYYNGECAKINLTENENLDEVINLLVEIQK